jgi:nucleotide-binding universal stress UspA family protein
MELKRVVVGLDGSAAAAAAAHWAAEAVRDSGGEVLAVHAVEPPPELVRDAFADVAYGLGLVPSDMKEMDEVRRILDEEWCRPFRDVGVRYRTVVSHSDPVHALLGTARREDADAIVIGHQSDTGLLQRLFQGVSDHLVDHARRPVVVVPFHPAAAPLTRHGAVSAGHPMHPMQRP